MQTRAIWATPQGAKQGIIERSPSLAVRRRWISTGVSHGAEEDDDARIAELVGNRVVSQDVLGDGASGRRPWLPQRLRGSVKSE